ncbi:MAG: DUF2726 domain-containing protein [Rubrivivax sp.]|nr:DUF2726 domain-containing protein [Rubrivivax sp.]
MDALSSFTSLALAATALLVLSFIVLRQRMSSRRASRERREALDTVVAWPPEAARVLTITERQAYDLLKRAMPGYVVLGQVPLSRFLRVPSRHSYSDWLQRVGSLSADLLLCDAGSRVLAVVDIRPAAESERSRRRHERMARVMRAAQIHVHVWREGALPSTAEVRTAMAHVSGPAAAGIKSSPSRPMPLIPIAEMSEVLADGDRTALDQAMDTTLEPMPSGYYDDLEPSTSTRH